MKIYFIFENTHVYILDMVPCVARILYNVLIFIKNIKYKSFIIVLELFFHISCDIYFIIKKLFSHIKYGLYFYFNNHGA